MGRWGKEGEGGGRMREEEGKEGVRVNGKGGKGGGRSGKRK